MMMMMMMTRKAEPKKTVLKTPTRAASGSQNGYGSKRKLSEKGPTTKKTKVLRGKSAKS